MKNSNYLTRYLNNDLMSPFDKMVKEVFGQDYYPMSRKNSIGSVNVVENEDDYTLEINVPGYNKEDIEIHIEDGVINIFGKVESEKNDEGKNYTRKEFSSSTFNRSFILPENYIDDPKATMLNGILYLKLDKKKEVKKDAKRIVIE